MNFTLIKHLLTVYKVAVSCANMKRQKDIMKKLFRQIRKNADSRKIEVDIDLEYLKELYDSQAGKCAISGIEMTYDSYTSNNISPDRIDTRIGYVKGNIHLVCNIINIMKWDFGLNDFLQMCKVVSDFNSF